MKLRGLPLLGVSLLLVLYWPQVLAWLGWGPVEPVGSSGLVELARSTAQGLMQLVTGDGELVVAGDRNLASSAGTAAGPERDAETRDWICAEVRRCANRATDSEHECGAKNLGHAERFVGLSDGTMIDRITGLQWQRKCSGPKCAGDGRAGELSDWPTAVTKWMDEANRASGIRPGSVDRWRLPDTWEVRGVLRNKWECQAGVCVTPQILGFEGSDEVYLWTSTVAEKDAALAWRAELRHGFLTKEAKSSDHHVLAVRSCGREAPQHARR